MTSNHLLLYRLAELMLQHEQHMLPVDLLFDDEEIGEFVKSVQIDSPYQQMLFDGVITESVRDEKLFVYFTVEGYFHYVLGEVIFQSTRKKEPKELLYLFKSNQLNGIKQGLEQCLIRDVQKNDLFRLMWLIDSEGETNTICTLPLAYSFINVNLQIKSSDGFNQAINNQISFVLDMLLAQPSDSDIEALTNSINILKEVQKVELTSMIYLQINKRIKPDNLNKSILFVKTIEHLPESERKKNLDRVKNLAIEEITEVASKFNFFVAKQLNLICEYEEAIKYYEKSLEIKLKIHGDQHPSIARTYHNLGSVWKTIGKYDQALYYYEKTLALDIKIYGDQHPSTATTYNSLGLFWSAKGNLDKAIKYYEKTLALDLKIYGDQHPSTATTYNNLGYDFTRKGEYNKAIEYYGKSLAIRLKVNGDQHPSTGTLYNNIGMAWNKKGDYSKAIKYYRKSLQINLQIHGPEHYRTSTDYNNLGFVSSDKGDFASAIDFFEKSLAIRQKVHGGNHESIAIVYNNLGLVWSRTGELTKAVKYFELSLKIISNVHGNQHPSVGIIFDNLGDVYKFKEDFKTAIYFFQKAYSIFTISLGEKHFRTVQLQEKLENLNDI
jgi:tetratricopeptide (TPR) repeat protein